MLDPAVFTITSGRDAEPRIVHFGLTTQIFSAAVSLCLTSSFMQMSEYNLELEPSDEV
jgi:hypothetical protein